MCFCIVVMIETTGSNLDSGYDMISTPLCHIQLIPIGHRTERKVFIPPAAALPCDIVDIKHDEAMR